MAKIIVSFKKPSRAILVRESREEFQVQQIDEAIALGATAYKFLGPLHDVLMRLDTSDDAKKPPWVKGLINWYKNNPYTQMLGDAMTQWEKTMTDLWESGPAGKSAVLAIHASDLGGSVAFTTLGAFVGAMRKRWIAEEEKGKEEAAKELERLQYEKSAERTVEEQNKIIAAQAQKIARFQSDKANRLLVQAEDGRKMLANIATAHGHDASQETMYQPVNETKDKKMTKKYSSFKQQHMITESFRKYINEEDELESLISYLDPNGRKGVYDLQQAIASGTKIEFADDSAKTDLLQLSADVDAKVDLDLGDYWEFVEPEYLRKYTEEYDNAREALDRDYMDDPGAQGDEEFNEIKVSDQLGTKPNNLTKPPGKPEGLDDEQKKMVTYWASRMKAGAASVAAWIGDEENREALKNLHDDMRKLGLDPWTMIKKIKSAQVQKENKVRFTKRQLQKIIKEEIKKVTKKKK